jgi:hypothetical protein
VAENLAVNIVHCLERLLKAKPGDIAITSTWIRGVHQHLAGELFPNWAGRYRA